MATFVYHANMLELLLQGWDSLWETFLPRKSLAEVPWTPSAVFSLEQLERAWISLDRILPAKQEKSPMKSSPRPQRRSLHKQLGGHRGLWNVCRYQGGRGQPWGDCTGRRGAKKDHSGPLKWHSSIALVSGNHDDTFSPLLP